MASAKIKYIEKYLPDEILKNEHLCNGDSLWTPEKILLKTGIEERRISSVNETSVDLGVGAAEALFKKFPEERAKIDYLIFCTQTPDYFLPSSSCVIQDRLGLNTSVGAVDVNQGCSGYVYSLSLGKGLIAAGIAENILLITADTYSKIINENDTSVRTLFGDGATATIITTDCREGFEIGDFLFGTDGSGANNLIVPAGAFRTRHSADTSALSIDNFGNTRTQEQLYMDGGQVMTFGLSKVPIAVNALLQKNNICVEDIDHFIFHQASLLVINKLSDKLKIDRKKVPISLRYTGNTVSSTIPITLAQEVQVSAIQAGAKIILVGFGVGFSWAACLLET